MIQTSISLTSSFLKIPLFIFFIASQVLLLAQDDLEYVGFHLYFEETASEEVSNVLNLIAEDEELLGEVVDDLNDYLDIPIEIPIIFRDCNEANAFYNPETNEVSICHEMIVLFHKIYVSMGLSGEELSLAIANTTFSIMYHEVGHALVDILQLPITGREEDAVDQFSVVSLLVFEELGQDALIHFASFWGSLSQATENSMENLPFWDEHSLSAQRFYDILCLAYGSDPDNLSYLVENGVLPESRAGRCGEEFERVLNAWETLLEPHVWED